MDKRRAINSLGPEVAHHHRVTKTPIIEFDSRRLHHSTRTYRTLARGALGGDSAVSQSKGTMSGGSPGQPAPPSCVYILRCADNSLYVGSNTGVAARETAHDDGRGAKCASGRRPVRVVCSESHESRSTAKKRKYQLKHWTSCAEGSACCRQPGVAEAAVTPGRHNTSEECER